MGFGITDNVKAREEERRYAEIGKQVERASQDRAIADNVAYSLAGRFNAERAKDQSLMRDALDAMEKRYTADRAFDQADALGIDRGLAAEAVDKGYYNGDLKTAVSDMVADFAAMQDINPPADSEVNNFVAPSKPLVEQYLPNADQMPNGLAATVQNIKEDK